MKNMIPLEMIEQKILSIRGHRVMLDSDLAELYDVRTKNLNKAVSRNMLALKLEELEKRYDAQFRSVFDAIRALMAAPPDPDVKKIPGFKPEK